MALRSLRHFVDANFAPPAYLAMPTAGIDVSASSVKVAVIKEGRYGLELAAFGQEKLPTGAFASADVTDMKAVAQALAAIAKKHGVTTANIALPESRTYLFETQVAGKTDKERSLALEQKLDEFVPLPPADVAFDFVDTEARADDIQVVGVGFARRIIAQSLALFDDAGIRVRSIESELFSMARAILPPGDDSTILVIDIGKTTTKLIVVANRIPRYATTFDVGGHALTIAVQKYFGVTDDEARKVKAEKGLVVSDGNQEYLSAMLSTVSVIREEIMRRLDYWQTRAVAMGSHKPVSRAIVVGGNASVKGLPEYLSAGLKIPVELGDVFANFASRDAWLPPVDYLHSLAYTTAIGLALRQYVP